MREEVMLDPLSAFENIKDFYITYLETAFRIRWPELQQQRRKLLEQVGQLCTALYLEPIPRYKSSGVHLDAANPQFSLQGFSDTDIKAFVELALAGLFEKDSDLALSRSKFALYQHQLEMLQRGVQRGLPGVVTSGTGSGKTEAFLLPLLARIAQEAKRWKAPAPGYLENSWWDDANPSPFQSHRQNESRFRPKAVRALILYPMNALVEDQMVRLRKALDSPEAHQACDQNFNGNRIFFGRYTSATPVTGFETHPRMAGDSKQDRTRENREKRLRTELKELAATQLGCLTQKGQDPDIRFNFANPSGSELVSRWDMQQTPPDILITNISMLNGMLAREVEEPIWESTRQWIQQDPDAYFYLIVDELHLQRGSAGTEFCYLLRILLNRLGLDQADHRHKLHILTSSASLPMTPDDKQQSSLDYLWDMFGPFGLTDTPTAQAPTRDDWESAVVTGAEQPAVAPLRENLTTKALCKANEDWSQGNETKKLNPAENNSQEKLWREIAGCLGVADFENIAVESLIRETVNQASALIIHHCDQLEGGTAKRATSSEDLAKRIFSDGDGETKTEALQGLLKVRGWGDRFSEWFGGKELGLASSFRAHAFLRAVDGLFCGPRAISTSSSNTPTASEKCQSFFSDLGVERGLLYAGGKDKVRKVEVLYCECCGDLFYGGMRGPAGHYDSPELMPTDPDLDSLPELARDNQFENLSADQYAIFWPRIIEDKEPKLEPRDGCWVAANYNPSTSVVTRGGSAKPGAIEGYLYDASAGAWEARSNWFLDQKGRGSATPSQCPSCGLSYRNRTQKKHGRSSPIRNFRAGFGKTSQLIATELLHQLRQGQKEPDQTKLICFTDSRQEAARTALDLEKMHHEDVVRELLVACLRDFRNGIPKKSDLPNLITKQQDKAKQAAAKDDFIKAAEYQEEEKRLKDQLNIYPDSVPIGPIALKYDSGGSPPPLLQRLAELGIHPTDAVGTKEIEGADKNNQFAWQDLYKHDSAGDIIWRTDPNHSSDIEIAQQRTCAEVRKTIRHTVFQKTYFALEEAGLGYGVFELRSGDSRAKLSKHDAMLRVFQDNYRVHPSAYEDDPDPWSDPSYLPKNGNIRKKFEELYGVDSDQEIQEFLDVMKVRGHDPGILNMDYLHIRLTDPDDPYWRCENCARAHLHKGFGNCTRCPKALPQQATGTCAQLRNENFLGMRVQSSFAGRIRSEELTGMTADTSARLRRFKGIFINDTDTSLPQGRGYSDIPEPLMRVAKTIDVLSVTTTMEVGVDIGDLQGTYQANMPPQRFNYQQRVGRSGRRGQAYSLVLTMCRSKSHDLYYFRHPKEITGDPPPPPFLTKKQNRIAQRLARKAWLWRAFLELRQNWPVNKRWPADKMQPDIHGEYVSTNDLKDPQQAQQWQSDLQNALQHTLSYRDEVGATLLDGSAVTPSEIFSNLNVIDEIWGNDGVLQSARSGLGLAEALADCGYFPLYGLPTQVRYLYTGFKKEGLYLEPETIDRNAEMAVAEFAPGNCLMRDKKIHEVLGFTDSYPIRLYLGRGRQQQRTESHPLPEPIHETIKLYKCDNCDSWNKQTTSMRCDGCQSPLNLTAEEFKVPNGFRTRLNGGVHPDDAHTLRNAADTGSRTVKAQAMEVKFTPATNGIDNLAISINEQTESYSFNRGPDDSGWEMLVGSTTRKLGKKRHEFKNQWVLEDNKGPDFVSDGTPPQNVKIGSRKITDSLFIAPISTTPFGFFLNNGHTFKSSIRAALISAAYLIVNKAAFILDVDPAEFDIHEPRAHGQDPDKVPLIQISDHLVNGSGFLSGNKQKTT